MKKVGIVTDSIACLPEELVEDLGIRVVPINVICGDKVYRDGVDLTPSEVYRLLKEGKIPTTSAPSPGAYLEVYRELSQEPDSIVCIALPPELTMVYQSAMQARELLANTTIEVMDCRPAAGAQGLIALAAARAAAEGKDLGEVSAVVKDMIGRVRMVAMMDTLYYLAKGGRIPKAAAWAGSMLKVKPLLTVSRGTARLVTAVRTKRRAVERLLEIMRDSLGSKRGVHVMVMHADVPGEAEGLKERITSEFKCTEIYVRDFTPVMGVHTGPGLLGIAFHAEG